LGVVLQGGSSFYGTWFGNHPTMNPRFRGGFLAINEEIRYRRKSFFEI